MIFQCPQCSIFFEEEDGADHQECCVGGHWTPHGAFDRIPTWRGMRLRCCHTYQTRHHGILLPEQGCTKRIEQ